ncbi:hypothetical protein EDB92DRAFT_1505534 [Lactarius akahatsu]|uniref:Uncharacterized protein n=1 Tax=Lactarius akahatsu TaxID=416441 RepID=A0AAD4QG15_9AGAM|nr:hypothetical protein EDB92DRAFT_1505534 [Lactarius akahatsu]
MGQLVESAQLGVCAMDYEGNGQFPITSPTTPGIIVDDDMHDIMVKPLPPGYRLTAVLDYDSRGRPKQTDPIVVQRKSSEADISVPARTAKEPSRRARVAPYGKFSLSTRRTREVVEPTMTSAAIFAPIWIQTSSGSDLR